ncbi:hypothetical protein ACLKA6_010246 [Drosophila palustris]
MADEEDPWGFDGGDDAGDTKTSQAASTDAAPSKAESLKSEPISGTPQAADAAGEPDQENVVEADVEIKAPPPPPEDDGYRKPVQLYRHWVRPKFLQYKYMLELLGISPDRKLGQNVCFGHEISMEAILILLCH